VTFGYLWILYICVCEINDPKYTCDEYLVLLAKSSMTKREPRQGTEADGPTYLMGNRQCWGTWRSSWMTSGRRSTSPPWRDPSATNSSKVKVVAPMFQSCLRLSNWKSCKMAHATPRGTATCPTAVAASKQLWGLPRPPLSATHPTHCHRCWAGLVLRPAGHMRMGHTPAWPVAQKGLGLPTHCHCCWAGLARRPAVHARVTPLRDPSIKRVFICDRRAPLPPLPLGWPTAEGRPGLIHGGSCDRASAWWVTE
jgi:hypothetical protein